MSKRVLKSVKEMDLLEDNNEVEISLQAEYTNGIAEVTRSSRIPVQNLKIEDLIEFKNHPFQLYTGKRLSAMIQSIREFGIISPIIVRTKENGKYEILAGHNRVNAARMCNLDTVPTIVKEVQCDEEALLIVTETNFMQRSFSEMSYSERALMIYQHHQTLKAQGRRQDLLVEIEEYMKQVDNDTSCQPGEKLSSDKKVGEQYNLSGRTISRYLRVYQLYKGLQDKLDNEEISFLTAEVLSYLREESQQVLYQLLCETGVKLTMQKAEVLKKEDIKQMLSVEDIKGILLPNKDTRKIPNVKVGQDVVKKYFQSNHTEKEIQNIIEKALEAYFVEQNLQ